jgi:hypothetical protein
MFLGLADAEIALTALSGTKPWSFAWAVLVFELIGSGDSGSPKPAHQHEEAHS